jgi:hypothetical protein
MWMARVLKIQNQLEHLEKIVEFFLFCSVLAGRFRQYLLQTSGNKYEIKSFLELYETWSTTEYDMFLV